MQTKFYGNAQQASMRNTIRTAARYAMADIKSDIHFYMTNGTDANVSNPFDSDSKEYADLESFYEKNGGLFHYYDSAKYITSEQSENREGHIHISFDDKGRDALRIYIPLGESKSSKIEFLYTDFNVGVSFSITSEGWAQWFVDQIVGAGIVDECMDEAAAVNLI